MSQVCGDIRVEFLDLAHADGIHHLAALRFGRRQKIAQGNPSLSKSNIILLLSDKQPPGGRPFSGVLRVCAEGFVGARIHEFGKAGHAANLDEPCAIGIGIDAFRRGREGLVGCGHGAGDGA
ncbi:hypothetical protein SDC9_157412 [bioreactor metagenome]|uniref:Uncharacterized protein n=1 Tax=bioreactor metagenome TaxID=1076179 RepID=A0A645F9X7_9ZZZZ